MTARAGGGYPALVALAAPIAGIQLAQVALTSVDLAMLGLLGVSAVAAGGLALLLYNQVRTMCVGMVTGVGNLVAAAAGAGELRTGTDALDDQARDEIRSLLRSALLVATVAASAGAAVLCGLALALPLLGQRPEIVTLAGAMMFALAGGLFPMVWLNVLRQFAVGMRRPGSLLAVTLVSIAVNAGCNAAFIYGWAGLPRLGVAGVGLSTTVVQFFTLAAFASTVRRDPRLRAMVSLTAWRADPVVVRRIVRHGTPICFTYGSEAAITSIATLLMGAFGPAMLAASNVANQLAYIVYQCNIGLSQGSSILVSRAVGQSEPRLAPTIARRALALSWTFMAVVSVAYVVAPLAMLWPFLHNETDAVVLGTASTLLLFAIAQQYSKGTQNILVGLLRGLGDTASGLRCTLIGYWAVGVPAMVLCAYGFGWGGWGVWTGLCVGFAATAVLLAYRFRSRLQLPLLSSGATR
ncbi:MATE family efflux transporter [Kibdelosporangium phytohabitans]|uniref:Probable multidrug resistance protein NorM n=1 Tax=Kibdelosporangium phytohabitans TaxID=860235 RepID=A0A0N9I6K8_9PSEU|nr:MATE family efflux transporter [Kibdelosporangium phytohabitans]ALG10533.1 MATE family efflux transporter [Kibdelosporangium phytohabitans]MBE1461630.1 MATE family multidrug resistance protein [Kibdelosporangium phytohabitans]